MFTDALHIEVGLAAGAVALGWTGYRLSRDPGNTQLWLVGGIIVSYTFKYVTSLRSCTRAVDGALGAGASRLIWYLSLFLTCYLLVCFFQ